MSKGYDMGRCGGCDVEAAPRRGNLIYRNMLAAPCFTGGSSIDIPAVKARLAAYRHRAVAATLVARRLALAEANAAELDEQLGLLQFEQVRLIDKRQLMLQVCSPRSGATSHDRQQHRRQLKPLL